MKRIIFTLLLSIFTCVTANAALIQYTASGTMYGLETGPLDVSGSMYISDELSFWQPTTPVPANYDFQSSQPTEFVRPVSAIDMSIGNYSLQNGYGYLYMQNWFGSALFGGSNTCEWMFYNQEGEFDTFLSGNSFTFYDSQNNSISKSVFTDYLQFPEKIAITNSSYLGNYNVLDSNQLFNSVIWLTRTGASAPVPEPATFLLLLTGIGGVATVYRRKNRA